MSKQILLTISILISNRPDTVRKCLDSVKPLRENVPSELILVDTGCGEQVRAVIEEYTDQIIDFEWCRDFSKARNAGLEKARGQWFLFLDDDEWFEDVTEMVDFFNSGEYREYGLAVYTQRNYLERDGSVYTDLLVARMTKLSPDTRFVYRVHECFNAVRGRTKKFNAYVHHYGYVYASTKESHAHSMRNISLLLEEHEEDPGNLKHILQLAQEYNVLDEYSKSLEMSLEAVALYEQGKIRDEYFLSSLFANEIGCYMDLYRYEDAVRRGEFYLRHKRPDKMVKDMIAGYLATAYLEQGDYARSLENARRYWDGYQDYLQDEESFMGFVTTITNKCFEDHFRSIALGNGMRSAVLLGEGEQAWQWFESFDWTAPQIFASQEMIRTVVERMPEAEAKERALYVRMCNIMIKREELESAVLRAISDCCRNRGSLEGKVDALAAYEGVETGHWLFALRKIVLAAFLPQRKAPGAEGGTGAGGAADGEQSLQEVETLAGKVWENPNLSMSSIRAFAMLEAVERLGGSNRRVLEGVPFYLWKKGIQAYFAQFTWEDANWWNGQFQAALPEKDARMLHWRALYGMSGAMRAAERWEREKASALSGGGAGNGAASRTGGVAAEAEIMREIEEGLQIYAVCQTELCEIQYKPEIIRQSRDMLPEECQSAYRILDLLEQAREGRYGEAVGSIREIRRFLPGLTSVMRPYLQWIDARLKSQVQESRQAAGEFQVLARQIKEKIRSLMVAGQRQAALGLARQLQALLPEDEELQRILGE